MKKLTTAAFALLLGVGIVFASSGDKKSKKNTSSTKSSVSYAGEGVFDFELISDTPGKVNVKILSSSGKELFEQKITHKNSVKVPFDLSELNEGSYQFVVEKNGRPLENHEVFLSKIEKKDLAAFVKKINDEQVQLRVYHDNTPVSVSIIDDNGREYFSERINIENNFSQVFNLEQVPDESLTVVVSTSRTSISKSL